MENVPATPVGTPIGMLHVTYADVPVSLEDGPRRVQSGGGPASLPAAAEEEDAVGFIETAAGALASALFVAGDGFDVYVHFFPRCIFVTFCQIC